MRLLVCSLLLALTPAAPAQDWAKARLEKSPRHGEWVKVRNGPREVQAFLVYPESKEKATCWEPATRSRMQRWSGLVSRTAAVPASRNSPCTSSRPTS